jgi:hypothetical protein
MMAPGGLDEDESRLRQRRCSPFVPIHDSTAPKAPTFHPFPSPPAGLPSWPPQLKPLPSFDFPRVRPLAEVAVVCYRRRLYSFFLVATTVPSRSESLLSLVQRLISCVRYEIARH